MAAMVKTTSSTTTTYVITGQNGSTVTAAFGQVGVQGLMMTSIANSGNVGPDAQAMLDTLIQLTTTGLLPEGTPPTN